ncbi:MAG: hypothetical protein B7X95_07805 [Methylophilaceae bacterium 17-44-8]|nr:MAG: hypothetical protein B7Y32_00405 [Methylophilales bacterium 16-45-7]OZA05081.1 MAG: hypothetical protein B7X95_07805 [Methylophilaceae bacterium 17-44-8]
MNWKLAVFILLIGYGAYQHYADQAAVTTSGSLTQQLPAQTDTDSPRFQYKHYTITPLAQFALKARVLAREDYRFDRGASLAPVDLALGWGAMSDSQVLSQMKISQSNRFYFWHVDTFPIPRQVIETHSANMHMIPADDQVEAQLKQVRVGQMINIEGYLVQANATDGFYWKSSLTRNDTGAGACELVFVKKVNTQ